MQLAQLAPTRGGLSRASGVRTRNRRPRERLADCLPRRDLTGPDGRTHNVGNIEIPGLFECPLSCANNTNYFILTDSDNHFEEVTSQPPRLTSLLRQVVVAGFDQLVPPIEQVELHVGRLYRFRLPSACSASSRGFSISLHHVPRLFLRSWGLVSIDSCAACAACAACAIRARGVGSIATAFSRYGRTTATAPRQSHA